jgi:hypothetical protein
VTLGGGSTVLAVPGSFANFGVESHGISRAASIVKHHHKILTKSQLSLRSVDARL